MLYSKNQIYKEEFVKVEYTKNYYEYVLLKNCRQSGFEEIKNEKKELKEIFEIKDIKKTDNEEIDRIEKSRIKSKIKEYSLCNEFQFFFTQTLNSSYNRYDLEEFKKNIQKKFKSYKRINKSFTYLIIFEHHKDGAYHLHGLVSGLGIDIYTNKNGYLSLKYFEDLGFNSLSKIKDNIKVAHYITKYISKDFQKTKSGYSYFHSQGLRTATRTKLNFLDYKDNLELVYTGDFCKKYIDKKNN